MVNQLIQNNSMMLGAAKYVYVKNGTDAKKATLVSLIGFLVLPFTWMIPAVASTVLHPILASEFPQLNNPHEASYVAMAITLLPSGLLGLIVSTIFAASVAYMTSLISIAAGIFVRNFYIRVIRKDSTEARQIAVRRIFTLFYGLLWMVAAMFFKNYKSLPLFDLLLLCAASIQIPMVVPLFLGMFVKRTPPWAGWSTMVAGFAVSLLLRVVLTETLFNFVYSPTVPFSDRELGDLNIATTTAVLFIVCISWFFATMLFYKEDDREYVEQVERFFKEMKTPIDGALEHGLDYDNDNRQYHVIGNLCLIYGGFILLLLLIPNPAQARLCILFCGGLLVASGSVTRLMGKRLEKRITQSRKLLVGACEC